MRYIVIIVALMIALPAFAGSGCTTLPVTGCRFCWNDKSSSKTCPNGDWEKRNWSDWLGARHRPIHRRHPVHRHHSVRPAHERVIERETLRYEHVIEKHK